MKHFFRNSICLAALLMAGTSLFAQTDDPEVQQTFPETPDLYADADTATKQTISSVNDLIEKKQYKTAFDTLGTDNSNPFILAKKIELYNYYFAKSTIYQTAAFKDLEEGEFLELIRMSDDDTLVEVEFKPIDLVEQYESANGDCAILDKVLGDYYVGLLMNFPDCSPLSNSDIYMQGANYYNLAIKQNCFDVKSLHSYGICCLHTGDYENAKDSFTKELQYTKSADAHYYLSYAYLNLNDFTSAAAEGEKAVSLYDTDSSIRPENIPTYKADAYLMCADAMLYAKNYDSAINYTNKILEVSDGDYRAYDEFIAIYIASQDFKNAAFYSDKLFSVAPDNPAATQMVFKHYLNSYNDELESFVLRNITTYADKPSVLGNLYYHLAYLYYTEKRKDESIAAANLCKDNFVKSNEYEGDTKDAVDEMISTCQN